MIYLICVEKTGEVDQGRKYLLQDTTEKITIFVGIMESKGIAIAIFILKSVASKMVEIKMDYFEEQQRLSLSPVMYREKIQYICMCVAIEKI